MLTALILIALLAAFVYDAEPLLDRWLQKRVIVNCDRDAYLLRWYVFKSKWVTLFVHKFVRSDEDRALHDHPWAFLVIPVWRGYVEHSDRAYGSLHDGHPARWHYDLHHKLWRRRWNERTQRMEALPPLPIEPSTRVPVQARVLPLLGIRYRDTDYRHRVELLAGADGQPLPAWSLFFHFEKIRDWGFWAPDGFIQWNKWWQDKCE